MDSEGQPKFRAVDDFSRSEVNANTAPTEKLGCDTLDMLWEIMRSMKESFDSEVHVAEPCELARVYCCAHACVSGGAVTVQDRCQRSFPASANTSLRQELCSCSFHL